MRARAQELGLADAEVARRLDISQSRYANYIADIRQPDFATFLRICSVLAITPNQILGVEPDAAPANEADRLRQRIVSAIGSMDEAQLSTVVKIVDAMTSELKNSSR